MKKVGYGQGSYDGKLWLAHRLAWTLANGPIPDGAVIDHECHTRVRETCVDGPDCPHRRCVNPAHMRLVTRTGNALAGNSPLSHNKRKTHCDNNHLLEGDNLRIRTWANRAPSRECITCSRERARESRRKAKLRAQEAPSAEE